VTACLVESTASLSQGPLRLNGYIGGLAYPRGTAVMHSGFGQFSDMRMYNDDLLESVNCAQAVKLFMMGELGVR
jgi:hypothetical protein